MHRYTSEVEAFQYPSSPNDLGPLLNLKGVKVLDDQSFTNLYTGDTYWPEATDWVIISGGSAIALSSYEFNILFQGEKELPVEIKHNPVSDRKEFLTELVVNASGDEKLRISRALELIALYIADGTYKVK